MMEMQLVEDSRHEALAESEARFRAMADHAPVLLWMARPDGLCEFFNQGWLEFTGRTLAEELGNGWAEGVHPEDFQACMHTYLDAFVARERFSMEYRLRRHDGVYRWFLDQGAPRFALDGSFAGFIGSCVDITEQRLARDVLTRLNETLETRVRERTAIAEEREFLLREVHHRVKNDLQLISSLLNMQSRQLRDPESIAALTECEQRVQAVALIHEHMYLSKNLGRLPFSENLRSLSANVFRIADLEPGAIRLEVEAEPGIELSVERAIPCGLIVNELITNSLKHAFPKGRRGTVRVELKSSGGVVTLSVSDDGIGFNPNSLSESLGVRLVEAFASQLGGVLHVTTDPGTSVTLEFDRETHKPPRKET
jgi:PAS domain S-box-containing protein